MNFSRYFRNSIFVLLILGFVPSVNFTGDSVSFSLDQTNKLQAFDGSFGQRESYTISVNYWVDLNQGDELCSYEMTESTTGQRCEDSWMTCTASGLTSTSYSWTGNGICVSLAGV